MPDPTGPGTLTLGGVPLICATAELTAWVRDFIPQHVARPWILKSWPGTRLGGVAWPTGFDPAWPVRVGRLCWPGWGACRFGYGHFLASAAQVSRIRDIAFGADGRSTAPLTLRMESPPARSPEAMEAMVYLLPPTPLATFPGDNAPYLLTVVDQRYYWWNISSPLFPIECQCTFDIMYDLCGLALAAAFPGWTWTARNAVDPAYVLPSRVLTSLQDEPLPIVLDSIAYNCGHRITVGLDGSVRALGHPAAQLELAAQLDGFPGRTLRAGGKRFLDVL